MYYPELENQKNKRCNYGKTKKLSVNTALCDMTEITEERLSQYSAIAINAAAVIQSEKSAVLISKYPVEINTACVIKVPEGINLIIKMVPLK